MSDSQEERRKFRRVAAKVMVEVKRFDPGQAQAVSSMSYSINLSANGLLVPSVEDYPDGSFVRLTFSLPGEKDMSEFFGKVVRCTKRSVRGYELGIALLEMPKGTSKKISRYVEKGW